MQKIAVSFNGGADIARWLEQARERRDALLLLRSSYDNLLVVLGDGAQANPREFSAFIDLAEHVRVVNREGMRVSGFHYVVNEERLSGMTSVVAEDILPSANHIIMQVDRALRILNRKPGAYNPANSPLYGTALKDWQPLLP